MSDIFSAFKHKNFRYFWSIQCLSFIGTWTQRAAQTWLVYSLTKSPLLLGILGVCQFGPSLLFSLFAGVIIDRFSIKKILLIAQIIFIIQSFAFYFLVLTNTIEYWQILILATIFGFAQTLDMPGRQSFVIELVGKEDLMNAISLNSTMVNLSKIIGPSIAGYIMYKFGSANCFLINALSYIPVIWIISIVKVKEKEKIDNANKGNILIEIKEGLKYIKNNKILRFTCIITFIISVFSNSEVIIPIYSTQVLHGSAREYSYFLSILGLGSLVGAMFMAYRSKKGVNKSILIYDAIFVSIAQILTYFFQNSISFAILVLSIGFFFISFLNMANSTLQMNSKNEFRGRVMSVYALLIAGTTPIGNTFSGVVMEYLGDDKGYFICGIFSLIFTIFLILFSQKNATIEA